MQHLECWTGALLANIFSALILCSREPFSSRDYNMLFRSVLTLLHISAFHFPILMPLESIRYVLT